MAAVTVLTRLWERRLLVAVGLAAAIALAVMLTYRIEIGLPPTFESRKYEVGVASSEVLVDSPNSQVIDLGGSAGADVASLSVRARLLADLVATNPLKDRIARRAGIPPHLLIALRPSTEHFVEPSPLETGATMRTSDPRASILSLRVHEELPIIGFDAQAPEQQVAARISNAAVKELDLYLKTAASATHVPSSRKIVVEPLGPARSSTSHRGLGGMLAALVAVFAFALWCAGILVVSGLVRGLREPIVEPPADAPAALGPPYSTSPRPAVSRTLADPPPALRALPEQPVEGPRRHSGPPPALDLPERPSRRGSDLFA